MIFVTVVLIRDPKHEVVHHSLFDYLSLEHEGIAMLLNFGIVEGRFDHIAVEF